MIEAPVTDADDGIRLDRWFKRHYPHVQHALVEKNLRKGLIRLDGKKVKSSERIEQGQVIRLPEELAVPPKEGDVKPRTRAQATSEDAVALKRMTLYEDDLVIVFNKPPGLAVQGGSGQDKHLDGMLHSLRDANGRRPLLVHRLDKDTSGVLVVAKSSKSAAMLSRKFAGKSMQKIYVALVIGLPLPTSGKIDLPLAKAPRGKDSRETVDVDDDDGKPAISEYKVLEHLSNRLSWMELRPITGRTHQLRVHMAALGHPIVGDGKYGGRESFVRGMPISSKLHLHAQRIIIPDLNGKVLDVSAPLPKHMRETRESLGMD